MRRRRARLHLSRVREQAAMCTFARQIRSRAIVHRVQNNSSGRIVCSLEKRRLLPHMLCTSLSPQNAAATRRRELGRIIPSRASSARHARARAAATDFSRGASSPTWPRCVTRLASSVHASAAVTPRDAHRASRRGDVPCPRATTTTRPRKHRCTCGHHLPTNTATTLVKISNRRRKLPLPTPTSDVDDDAEANWLNPKRAFSGVFVGIVSAARASFRDARTRSALREQTQKCTTRATMYRRTREMCARVEAVRVTTQVNTQVNPSSVSPTPARMARTRRYARRP